MAGFALANRDFGILRYLSAIVTKYYPLRLHRMYIINPNYLMSILWTIIRPLVADKWLETIAFTRDVADLATVISRERLPRRFGGSVEVDDGAWCNASGQALLSRTSFSITNCVR